MKPVKPWKWLFPIGALIVLVLSAGLAAAAPSQPARPPAANPTQTPVPAPKTGRISVATANVRSLPGTTTATVGTLRRGDRIQITRQRPGWFEIVYPNGSNKRGWVSARLVAVDRQQGSGAAGNPGAVPAPVVLDYRPPVVLWKWNGENQVKGQNWYFDILLMEGGNNQPYDTAQAYPGEAVKTNGVWSFAQPKQVRCDTQMMVRIAVIKDGKWAGWISQPGNAIPVGGSCGPEQPTCEGCGGSSPSE